MRAILRQSNTDLLREIVQLRVMLQSVVGVILPELEPYHNWTVTLCTALHQQVVQHLRDLALGEDAILPDLLSSSQEVTQTFYVFNQRWVSPILRAQPADRLCLKLLRWLHAVHPQTQRIPVGISDGGFASLPVLHWPTIYFIPPSARHGLLYLPLLFHEFGHLLYGCHKPEMDDLVRDVQSHIAELLAPSVQRNDLQAQTDEGKRRIIVETWYEWTQELFCDAVGFAIGGPAFALAFSMHLRLLGGDAYHMPPEDLARRQHPVTWLRVRLLANRARQVGHHTDADALEHAWDIIAEAMDIVEDYYGFYVPEFLPAVQQTLDDMLTETSHGVSPIRKLHLLHTYRPRPHPCIS